MQPDKQTARHIPWPVSQHQDGSNPPSRSTFSNSFQDRERSKQRQREKSSSPTCSSADGHCPKSAYQASDHAILEGVVSFWRIVMQDSTVGGNDAKKQQQMATAKAGKRDSEMRDAKKGSCERRKKRRRKQRERKSRQAQFMGEGRVPGDGLCCCRCRAVCSVNPEPSEASQHQSALSKL